MDHLAIADPEVHDAINGETTRQVLTLELNAAANYASCAVLEAQGSAFAYKTLEGYPGKRYHRGHEYADVVELLAIERAKKLFAAEHANVQPHSGAIANLAVFLSILKPGDRILGMDLASGGHLSHGTTASLSGKFFESHTYGVVRDTELIDYERARHVALSARPRLIIAGASAYPRVIDFKRFGEIADEVGAYLLADIAHIAGLVAGGAHPTPVPYADFVTFTTYKTLRGSRGGIILCTKDLARQVDAAVFPGVQGSMHVHLIAAKAVTLKMAMTHQFADYAKQVVANARALSETLAEMGFRIVSGGTDNHIVLVDVRSTTGQSGKQAEEVLSFTGITANRNRIPYDRFGPDIASGIRLGSAALTTRGFRQNEMCEVGRIIGEVLLNSRDRALLEVAKGRARDLAAAYPVLGDRWEVGAHRASVEPEVVPLESAGPSVPDASQKAR